MKTKNTIGIGTALLIALTLLSIPQASKGAPIVGEIKIGIIGPQALGPHWYPSGMQAGAMMAASEINAGGGIYLTTGPNGTGWYNISLVYGHEHAITGAGGTPEPGLAADELERLMGNGTGQEDCTVVIGGFRTECVDAMLSVANSWGKPFFINGASTDYLVNATANPYVWRVNPVNSTILFYTIAAQLREFLLPNKLNPIFGHDLDLNSSTPNQTRVAVIAEDLSWNIGMYGALVTQPYSTYFLGPYAKIVYADRITPGSDPIPYIQAINASNARLLIHIFSGLDGLGFINQYGVKDLKVLPVGINVMGQMQSHWMPIYGTNGGCDYESILDFSGTGTPIIPGVTDVFWNNFVGTFTVWPLYTAWGAYDGVHSVAEAFNGTGTLDRNALKTYLMSPSYERQGLNGRFKFTPQQDVFSNEYGPEWTENFTRAMIVQWQVQYDSGGNPIDGRKEVVCPTDQIYSKKWAIPPEMYDLTEDINYDGLVNMRDVGAAARAFGTYPGHPRWEKEADINADNEVNMRDIGAIARQFGESRSLPVS